jgi:hypothetical protein
MRLGCFGCLFLTVGLMFLAIVSGGFLFLSGNILEDPRFDPQEWTRADASSARAKLAEIAQRDNGQSSRQDPILLSEREVAALVARHLAEEGGIKFEPFALRLTRGQFVLQGRTVVGNLLQGPPFAQLASQLPAAQLIRPIWITARGDITVDPGDPGRRQGRARITLTEFTLGKQPVGAWPFYIVMGPTGAGLLKWSVPGTVRDVEIDDRRLVIRTH